MAVTSLVLGILSVLLMGVPEVAIVLAILSVIFGRIKYDINLGKAGFILGVVVLSIYVLIFILALIGSISLAMI